MRQLQLLEPGKAELKEVPIPSAGPGEIVLKIRAALTCGTDLKTFRRGHPKFKLPMPFGHEFSGDIVEIGSGGVKDFQPGDAVMLAPTAPCGHCYYCRRNLGNLCAYTMETMVHGGYAQYIKLPAHVAAVNLFHKPDHLDYFAAAALEPLSCVVYGSSFIEVTPTQSRVLIIGAGPIGLMYIPIMKLLGARYITVLGRRALRLHCAEQMGADCVIDEKQYSKNELKKVLQDVFPGGRCDIIIECTGQTEVWERSLALADDNSQVMLFGGCAGGTSFNLPLSDIVKRGLSVKGAFHFTPQYVKKAYDLLLNKNIDISPIITKKMPLTKYDEIIKELLNGENIKIGVDPDF
ncbi:MAG: zinc-binding dehydrogenase [Candidatus Bruticola sp.]